MGQVAARPLRPRRAGGEGLAPAPAADKRTLIRRATFDLTGLPPTPEEVHAFLDDARPDAFARVVDRLLASPRYGERWGRHWLDVARYADSNGLDENLAYRHAWRYRDYVIPAFNKDKPYDQFLNEQLAGDLLPGRRQRRHRRSSAGPPPGFLSLGPKMLAEDDPVKMEMDIVDEQLDTTGAHVHGADGRLRPLPRPQVRPDPASRLLLAGRHFQKHEDDGELQGGRAVARVRAGAGSGAEEARGASGQDRSEEQRDQPHLRRRKQELLATEARAHVGAYLLAADDVLRYETHPTAARRRPAANRPRRCVARREVSTAAMRPARWRRERSNVPKRREGSLLRRVRHHGRAAGEYQLDLLEEEAGAGTVDVW